MLIKNKFYHPKQIENKANDLLAEYYKVDLNTIVPPVDIDKILEIHLNLNLLWESFNNSNILGGLIPLESTIILNEDLIEEFNQNKGLENFTKAHEVGHWILHVDQSSKFTEPLPGFNKPFEKICRKDGIKDWDEKNADKFACYLLMPKQLISPKINGQALKWPQIYKLAEEFKVSPTAMKNRLTDLGLVYIDDQGNFYRSKEEYAGQKQLV